jgi:uncharacterized damage-inducible protein DinB
MRAGSREIDLLLDVLDEAYDRPAWHGPNLRGALRGLSAARAARRPAPGRHSVWELVLHCAYWKHVVWRRLVGGPRGSFPRRPRNFPEQPLRPDAAAWKADLKLLDERHRRLREAVSALPSTALRGRRGRSSPARLIYGVAAHDVYHAGQIRLLVTLSAAGRIAARR